MMQFNGHAYACQHGCHGREGLSFANSSPVMLHLLRLLSSGHWRGLCDDSHESTATRHDRTLRPSLVHISGIVKLTASLDEFGQGRSSAVRSPMRSSTTLVHLAAASTSRTAPQHRWARMHINGLMHRNLSIMNWIDTERLVGQQF